MKTKNETNVKATKFFINEKADSVILTILYILLPPLWLFALFNTNLYEKNFKNKVTTLFNCYVIPPLTVIAVFFTIFYQKGIYPFGHKTIAWCDMTQQGVPYIMNFKTILEGDDGLFLNMANAAGMDGWTLLKAYFTRPFNYLVLFVDKAEIMDFITVITVIKLAACSVTSMVFFRTCVKKLDPAISVALSLMYSFCAFGTMYYQIVNWPDAMYILPLYFAGIYKLVNDHKIGLFVVSLALVMLNFAFGYMTVIATLLFMGYYFIVKSDANEVKRTGFEFAIGSALAALLCAPTWLSFFGAYNDSARGVNLAETLESSKLLTTKNTAYPLLMSTAFIFIAAFAYKAYKKQPVGKALYFLFGMMMIPMVFEPINKMWHAGSYMGFPNRYAYILIYCGLAIAGIVIARTREELPVTESEENLEEKKTKRFIVYGCASVLLACICYILFTFIKSYMAANISKMDAYATTLWGDSSSYNAMLLFMAFFLVVYGIGYIVYKKGWITKRIFAMFLAAVVLCEGYVSINTYVIPATSKVKSDNFRAYGDLADRIEDDDFYRVKNSGFLNTTYSISEANFPGALGYKSMGHYSSLTSETYLYAAKAYGYSSVWMKIESFGGTKFSDALFSVKYQLSKNKANNAENTEDIIYANDKYCIQETEYYLPLGTFTPQNNVEIDVNKVTRIELQEKVFDSITNGKSDLFEYIEPSEKINCTLKFSGNKYNITKSGSNKAYLEYTVDVKGTQTIYFDCFDTFSNNLTEAINESFNVSAYPVDNPAKKQSASKFPKDSSNGLLNLGTYTNTVVKVRLEVLKNVKARSFGVYTMSDEVLEAALNDISTASLANKGNKVYGNYAAEENGYLFISLPYNPNYKCKVNGKNVKPVKAFGGFTAVPVTKGDNSISVSYTPNMFYQSIAMMFVGIGIAAFFLLWMKKKKYQTVYDCFNGTVGAGATSALSVIAYAGVIIAFIAVVFAIYIYPMYIKLSDYF